jgi:hypothetical protein
LGRVFPGGVTWVLRAVMLAPAAALLIAALPRFASGMAQEAAFPVPPYMNTGHILPVKAYRQTAMLLAGTPKADGESAIAAARAAYLAGNIGPQVIAGLDSGLSHAPASAAGWTLLAVLRSSSSKAEAADALTVSLELAPREYYLAAWQMRSAATLWGDLSLDARSDAMREIREMWSGDRNMRRMIRDVMDTDGGAQLVAAAMADQPEELRALNRMVMRLRLGLPDGY